MLRECKVCGGQMRGMPDIPNPSPPQPPKRPIDPLNPGPPPGVGVKVGVRQCVNCGWKMHTPPTVEDPRDALL